MANVIRLKRRAAGGAAGAPTSLKSAEPAYNEQDDTLYVGYGDDGSGNATSVRPVAGAGTFATKTYVDDAVGDAGGGDMLSVVYDSNDDGKVNAADAADAVPWAGVTGKPSTFAPSAHGHTIADVTSLQGTLDGKAALASPALTGNPTAPTQTAGNNTTRLATTSYVDTAVAALIDGAPGTIDTLNELAAALGDDPNFAATVTASIAGKLTVASNLSDVANASTARGNLGLGSMATQSHTAVDIDGGTIDGVTFDGGTF